VAQFTVEFLVSRAVAVQMVRERVRSVLQESARFARATLASVETIVRSLAPVRGRKLVVLLSEGFVLGKFTGDEATYDMRTITDAATRAGVVVYSIDAGGLSVPAPAGDVAERSVGGSLVGVRARVEGGQDEARREGLRTVAEETGGFAVYNRNDVGAGLRRVLADNEVYYLLAYEPSSSRRTGRFRKIEVRLPGRPGLAARTRRGYFEPPERPGEAKRPARSAKEEEALVRERARDALTSVVPSRGLPVQLAVDFVALPDAGPTAVIKAVVDVTSLRLEPTAERHRGTIEVLGVVTDRSGSRRDGFAERLQLDLREETLDAVRRDGIGA
jgi:hypothetical protein